MLGSEFHSAQRTILACNTEHISVHMHITQNCRAPMVKRLKEEINNAFIMKDVGMCL